MDSLTLSTDTITAQATAPGRGGVGIVRISGPKAKDIASALVPSVLTPRLATYTPFVDANNDVIDQGIALFLKGLIPSLVKMYLNFKATAVKSSWIC